MSSFVPLNVEIESESEDEIDDSKEIQIEEALKLYQNALKLHSQGPAFYDEAENAYNELFRSEIFTYPESSSEAQRIELHDGAEDSEDDIDDSLTQPLPLPIISADGAPSSLPQILYLAYKNHGQFILDRLRDQCSRVEVDVPSGDASVNVATAASASLRLFVEALDRDDTDLELWRKVSRIGSFLGSRRIGRFCLEAVLETDDGTSGSWTEPLGLEEGFAIEQLKPLLQSLEDQLSDGQCSDLSKRQDPIIKLLGKHIDPCPYLPALSQRIYARESVDTSHEQVINVPIRTWASCGQAILLQLSQEMQGVLNSDPGANYSLALTVKDTATFQPPQPRTTLNSEIASAQTSATTDGRQNVIGMAPVSVRVAANAGDWLGNAEPSQPSPIAMDAQTVEQLIESPTQISMTDSRDSEKALMSVQESIGPIGPIGPTVSLPTRKRSSEAAEFPDATEGGRSRSKRIKARGSIDPDALRDSTADDWTRWYVQQLQIYHQADNKVFNTIQHTLSKLGSENCGDLQSLRAIVSPQSSIGEIKHTKPLRESSTVAALDLKCALDSWDLAKSKAFLNGHDPKDPAGGISGAQNPSFTAFLEHSNQDMQRISQLKVLSGDSGMEEFVNRVKETWMTLGQLSFAWMAEMLGRQQPLGEDERSRGGDGYQCRYESFLWPDTLKQSVVQILVNQDEAIYSELEAIFCSIEQDVKPPRTRTYDVVLEQHKRHKNTCMLLIQVIFELHLDIYGRITNPSSIVDTSIRLQQRDRLSRWAAFSSRIMNLTSISDTISLQRGVFNEPNHLEFLQIRFMWAFVVCNSLLEPDSRDSTVSCFQDLIHVIDAVQREMPDGNRFMIELPNNAIMPEISIQAAQKEISRLTTMDFFMGVFSSENNDSLTIIESLEPLLELSVNDERSEYRDRAGAGAQRHKHTAITASEREQGTEIPSQASADTKLVEALHFLKQGSLPLRLFLWQKLRDAYRAVNYPPQVLSCDLRIFELIVNHLSSSSYTESAVEARRDSLLRWLHRLDDHMTRILNCATSKDQPFECVDGTQIKLSLVALGKIQHLLHVFALWEDTIRVGQTPAPLPQNQNATKGLARSTDKFRDMIVKSWTLQHTLLKEAMVQYEEVFPTRNEDLTNLLEHMHHALGLRCYCSLANKTFLKRMKDEGERAHNMESWETNMAQLIFDLYGVKISSNATEMQDHGCLPEELDRRTALEIMDLVMLQVNRISIKDLLKSDLKFTIDKMQQVIKIPKIANSPARTFNNRLVNNYLKSPIVPLDLYRSLRGIGSLCGISVHTEGYEIASKGWYFLLGHVALAKFRSQKRTAAGSTDDLDIARTFLRHDLEFDMERWETWYRLAQVFDTQIEEDTTWTAEKLDNRMGELVILQRRAIHCYSMAVAVATRRADATFEDTSKMADLYADYGTRLYACTREPFSEKAFMLDDEHQRHYSSKTTGMFKNPPFTRLQLYSAWKLASTLLCRASAQKPRNWIILYTFGKVLWKMWGFGAKVPGDYKRVDHQLVIETFVRAIEACPEKRDNRHPEKVPILEPHYKLVSIVHKLVLHRRITPGEACRTLKATPYSRKVDDVHDHEHWKPYILQVLKALRSADKANWHHRMVARAAHIYYDDDPLEPQANVAAKNELNQSIFTKTLAIQVWKPDNERAGRHFVYTSRYVSFFTRLLYKLNDKTILEALARRIRKRAGEFLNHADLWAEVCNAYLKLLRHQPGCRILEGYADQKFTGMDPELYQNNAARLETWMQSQTTNPQSLDILREAIELQKLNNKLYKSNLFEDLIRDVYAHLYDSVIPELHAEENRVRMRVDNILTNPTPSLVGTPPPDQANAPGEQHRSKAKWVTGREIIRKAEAIAAMRAPTIVAKPLKPLAPAPATEQEKAYGSNPNLAAVVAEDADKDPGSSVPGSVHDSADDESELSEVDEAIVDDGPGGVEEGRPLLFPNLLRGKGTAEDPAEIDTETGGEVNEDVEAEDGDDVEMEEEEEPEQPAQVKESGVPEGNW